MALTPEQQAKLKALANKGKGPPDNGNNGKGPPSDIPAGGGNGNGGGGGGDVPVGNDMGGDSEDTGDEDTPFEDAKNPFSFGMEDNENYPVEYGGEPPVEQFMPDEDPSMMPTTDQAPDPAKAAGARKRQGEDRRRMLMDSAAYAAKAP